MLDSSLLNAFPPGIDAAFAYGSGVFDQPGLYSGKERGMLDVIFAVTNPVAWHQQVWGCMHWVPIRSTNPVPQNIARHRSHYSLLGTLGGAPAVCAASRWLDAPVYFNTLVPWHQGHVLKYGVVATATLLDDLHTWRHLYVAGRLHKPVRWLAGLDAANSSPLRAALDANERAACAASLLLATHDKAITRHTLLTTLVGLSYRGDVRVGIAEDRAKVQRIVDGSFAGLQAQYKPALAALEEEGVLQPCGGDAWHVCDNHTTVSRWLPASLRGLAPGALASAIAARVARSSRQQALLGLLSAGLARSLRYAGAKVIKAWR